MSTADQSLGFVTALHNFTNYTITKPINESGFFLEQHVAPGLSGPIPGESRVKALPAGPTQTHPKITSRVGFRAPLYRNLPLPRYTCRGATTAHAFYRTAARQD